MFRDIIIIVSMLLFTSKIPGCHPHPLVSRLSMLNVKERAL
jgi:hypothetical protein